MAAMSSRSVGIEPPLPTTVVQAPAPAIRAAAFFVLVSFLAACRCCGRPAATAAAASAGVGPARWT